MSISFTYELDLSDDYFRTYWKKYGVRTAGLGGLAIGGPVGSLSIAVDGRRILSVESGCSPLWFALDLAYAIRSFLRTPVSTRSRRMVLSLWDSGEAITIRQVSLDRMEFGVGQTSFGEAGYVETPMTAVALYRSANALLLRVLSDISVLDPAVLENPSFVRYRLLANSVVEGASDLDRIRRRTRSALGRLSANGAHRCRP